MKLGTEGEKPEQKKGKTEPEIGEQIEWVKRMKEFGNVFVAPFDARFPEQNQTG